MRRRQFIESIWSAAGAGLLFSNTVFSSDRHDFVPAQLLPRGLDKAPYPSALRSLMSQIVVRTSIDAALDKVDVRIESDNFFRYPFLYLAGRDAYDDLNEEEIRRLRALLDAGGMLFADDASGIADSAFDNWFRRQMEKVYPKNNLEPLYLDHTLFRTFYLLDRIGGRVLVKDSLDGITTGDLTPVIYSVNDFGGAWAADLYGQPMAQCSPGGETQRETSWRMGVNIVMYTLCLNYKKDRVHVEAILERRKLR